MNAFYFSEKIISSTQLPVILWVCPIFMLKPLIIFVLVPNYYDNRTIDT